MRPGRLLVAAEYTLFRAAIKAALEGEGDIAVVAEAGTDRAAVAAASTVNPDLVLIDDSLPPSGGLRACAAIKKAAPGTKVFLLAHAAGTEHLVAAVEAGVDGFATVELDLEGLLSGVRQVLRGETFVPARLLGSLLDGLLQRNSDSDRFLQLSLRLTRREREVLELLLEGCDHEAVADILSISPQTARTHIQNTIQKLGAHSRLEAVALAVEYRLVDRLRMAGGTTAPHLARAGGAHDTVRRNGTPIPPRHHSNGDA